MSRRRALVVVLVVAVLGATGAFSVAGSDPTAIHHPSPEGFRPRPVAAELSVTIRGTRTYRMARRAVPRAAVRAAAREVRETMAELYRVGFVEGREADADRVARLFSADLRSAVERDIEELTLGSAAARFASVRPGHASAELRFLASRKQRPIMAMAEMDFAADGETGWGSVPIEHRGRYLLRRLGDGWRIVAYDVERSIPGPGYAVGTAREAPPPGPREPRRAEATPEAPSKDLLFILAIGSDARSGEPVAGMRADALQIVGINLRKRRAGIVGIPRDSYVPIPGVGTRKINEALVQGGPELTVRTVRRLTGIPISGYLLTGFAGFRSLVGSVGGVTVRVPYRMNDPKSEARFRPGRRHLRGPHALAFTRNRSDAPGGDFGRSLNQGRFMVAALRQFRSDLREDPGALFKWLGAGIRYVRTDLSLRDMVALLLVAPSIPPSRVKNTVVSGTGATVGGASVVRLGAPAMRVFRDLRRNGMLGG